MGYPHRLGTGGLGGGRVGPAGSDFTTVEWWYHRRLRASHRAPSGRELSA